MANKFKVKDLGPVHYCLGLQITRNRGNQTITVSQEKYVNDILERFNMAQSCPLSTPCDPNIQLTTRPLPSQDRDSEYDAETRRMSQTPYRKAVGSLIYAVLGTRLDIAYAVGVASRFLSNPSFEHWRAVKRIFRYLQGTKKFALTYGGSDSEDPMKLVAYSDSDFTGSVPDRKSTSGYIFKLNNSSISWQAKKQPTVSTSTTEVEYIGLANTVSEAIAVRTILKEIGEGSKAPVIINLVNNATTIFGDNQGSIALAKNAKHSERTRHIDVKYHFIREAVSDNIVDIKYISTENMIADAMTKALPTPKHRYCFTTAGLLTTSGSVELTKVRPEECSED